MNNSFCSDFSANFFADLLAGLIVAVIVALWLNLWVGKRLSELAGSEQRKVEKRADLEKAIHYVEVLKIDVNGLLEALPHMIEWPRDLVDEPFRKLEWVRQVGIHTSLWDILQPSGELPKLLDPDLLGTLTGFYGHLVYARRAQNFVTASHLASPSSVGSHTVETLWRQAEYADMMLPGLKQALESGRDLPDKLDLEIRRLKVELRKA